MNIDPQENMPLVVVADWFTNSTTPMTPFEIDEERILHSLR